MAYDPLSPEVVYLLKGNVKYPGTAAQATAAQTFAGNRLGDGYPQIAPVTVSGTIQVAS